MSKPVQSWNFNVRDGNDPGTLLLPNGDRVPLPPRAMWKGGAKITVTQMEENGQKSYYVTATYDSWQQSEHKHLVEWLTGIAPSKLAEGGVGKLGFTIGGTLAGGLIRAVATILIPSKITSESFWRTTMSDGIRVTCVMLGFS
jgi:hypothetical protein